MWNTPGGEDGYTRVEYFRHRRADREIPDLSCPKRCMGLVNYFQSIRSLAGAVDNPVTMGIIRDWEAHSYVILSRWERECIFAMDRALRHSYGEVLKYHAERIQIKIKKGRDWSMANG